MIGDLLKELKELDCDTWDYIDTLLKLGFPNSGVCDPNATIAGYCILGALQKAIEAKGWGLQQFHYMGGSKRCVAAIFLPSCGMHEHNADSPAEALLAAYIEAIHDQR